MAEANNQNPNQSTSSNNHHRETDSQQLEIENQGHAPRRTSQRHPPVFIKAWRWTKNTNNQPRVANIVSFFALIIGLFLAIYTYKVFKLSQEQAESVIKSADASVNSAAIAQKTFEADTVYNNKNIRDQKTATQKADKADSIKTKRDVATFDLQKRVLDAQIASLKETQKEFETENQSYLQINDFDTLELKDNKILYITYKTYNLSKQPAKIISAATAVIYDKPSMDIEKKIKPIWKTNRKIIFANEYVIKESPENGIYSLHINRDTLDRIKNGRYNIYIYGEMFYKNLLTNKFRQYTFLVELYFQKKIVYSAIINENTDIPSIPKK